MSLLSKINTTILGLVTDKATARATAQSVDTLITGSIKAVAMVPTGVVSTIKVIDNAGGALATGNAETRVSDLDEAKVTAAIAGAMVITHEFVVDALKDDLEA